MLALLLVALFTTASAYDPFLDALLGKISPSECPDAKSIERVQPDAENAPEGHSDHDYSAEPTHDSWDNLYLPESAPEVILDPYGEGEQ